MKIVAKALVADNKGNILLLNRGMTHPNFPGHLDLPGGEVEEDEAWDVTVAREIAEEAGIAVTVGQLEKIFEIQHPGVVHILYVARVDAEKPGVTLSWEHSNYQWLSMTELISLPLPVGADKYYTDVIEYISSRRMSW